MSMYHWPSCFVGLAYSHNRCPSVALSTPCSNEHHELPLCDTACEPQRISLATIIYIYMYIHSCHCPQKTYVQSPNHNKTLPNTCASPGGLAETSKVSFMRLFSSISYPWIRGLAGYCQQASSTWPIIPRSFIIIVRSSGRTHPHMEKEHRMRQ